VIISMTIGHMIRLVVPLHLTETIGSILLILIGLYLLVSVYIKAPSSRKRQLSTYLKHPEKVDFDQSRSISIYEALFLGLALSIDAFGAGIAASLLHYHLLSTASLAALMTGAFLFFSMKMGLYLSQFHLMSRLTFLPPLLIMSIGLYHFFS
ncbi:MAG TPA: manganese efflux pump, partial [Pseudogracilibacillus sp.]|nr:manganese efflux pump [Pseudogracilibacillus sp.]